MNDIVDMSRFTEAKSDQLNADDLIGGQSRTLTVTKVTGTDGDQPVSIFYQGDNGKPFKPCKTIRRILLAVWGRYAQEYVGRSMTVYRDDDVTFGGLAVGGIRISHMSHLDKETTVVVMKSKGKKVGMKILPLKIDAGQDKPDKVATGTRALIENLQACGPGGKAQAILDSAEVQKQRAYLAKNRPELAAEVDACVAALQAADDDPFEPRPSTAPSLADDANNPGGDHGGAAQEGRDLPDMGEQPTLDQAKAALDLCETEDAVLTMLDSYRDQLSDEDLTAASAHAMNIVAQRWPA